MAPPGENPGSATGYGGMGGWVGILINFSETDLSGLQIFVLKNSRKQVSMASLIVRNHISRTWRCLRCRDIVESGGSPTDFTETHLRCTDIRIFHKFPTIQEWQYCQLHFSYAIRNELDQLSIQP